MIRFYERAMLYGTNRQALRALKLARRSRSVSDKQYTYLLWVAEQMGLQSKGGNNE